jgi:hypothetical protein
LVENAAGGGCLPVSSNGLTGWVQALRTILTDDGWRDRLAAEAIRRPLPTWASAARVLQEAMA